MVLLAGSNEAEYVVRTAAEKKKKTCYNSKSNYISMTQATLCRLLLPASAFDTKLQIVTKWPNCIAHCHTSDISLIFIQYRILSLFVQQFN